MFINVYECLLIFINVCECIFMCIIICDCLLMCCCILITKVLTSTSVASIAYQQLLKR